MWALILCAFQSIVGNFEAVPFLGLYFRVCRLPFISVSFAHCGYPSRSPCGSERCWNTRGSPIAVPYLFQFLTLPLTWLSDLASLWVFSSMTGIFLPTSHNPACLQPRVLDVSFLPFCRHWSLWSLIDSPRQSRGLKEQLTLVRTWANIFAICIILEQYVLEAESICEYISFKDKN